LGTAVSWRHIFLNEKWTAFVVLTKPLRIWQLLLEQTPRRVYQAQVADDLETELYPPEASYSDMAPGDADGYYYGYSGLLEDPLQEDDFYNTDDDAHTESTLDWSKPAHHN
jgi:hypothetical protein